MGRRGVVAKLEEREAYLAYALDGMYVGCARFQEVHARCVRPRRDLDGGNMETGGEAELVVRRVFISSSPDHTEYQASK